MADPGPVAECDNSSLVLETSFGLVLIIMNELEDVSEVGTESPVCHDVAGAGTGPFTFSSCIWRLAVNAIFSFCKLGLFAGFPASSYRVS
jgi:hypothetical protein